MWWPLFDRFVGMVGFVLDLLGFDLEVGFPWQRGEFTARLRLLGRSRVAVVILRDLVGVREFMRS